MADASTPSYDAVILAGGRAHRLGGVDKPALLVGDRSLLDRALDAVADAGRVVVVGPARTTVRPVSWVQEQPPGGGPVAALAAGLPHVTATYVAVLAADLPFVDPAVVTRLVSAARDRDGALLVDESGRDQLLVGVWRTAALLGALASFGAVESAPLGRLLGALDAVRLPTTGGEQAPWFDCDTEDDLRIARGLA